MFKKKKIAWFICQLVKTVVKAFLNVTSDDSVHTSVPFFVFLNLKKVMFRLFCDSQKGRAEVSPAPSLLSATPCKVTRPPFCTDELYFAFCLLVSECNILSILV